MTGRAHCQCQVAFFSQFNLQIKSRIVQAFGHPYYHPFLRGWPGFYPGLSQLMPTNLGTKSGESLGKFSIRIKVVQKCFSVVTVDDMP